jgi:hypothetical protein
MSMVNGRLGRPAEKRFASPPAARPFEAPGEAPAMTNQATNLLDDLRPRFQREPVRLFHAAMRFRRADVNAPGDLFAPIANLAARCLWPTTWGEPDVSNTVAWVSRRRWSEWHFYVDFTSGQEGLQEFKRLASMAWKLLDTRYQPQPINDFPAGDPPRQQHKHEPVDGWLWWLSFVYLQLERTTRMVVRASGQDLHAQ